MSEPYMAFALQPKVYGCADRKEAKKNLKNLCAQIDGCMYVAEMEYPAKLVAVPEGAITGFYDEHSRMDYTEIVRKVALRLPGEETDVLAEKARQWGIYIIAAAKVVEPDLFPDRYFNTALSSIPLERLFIAIESTGFSSPKDRLPLTMCMMSGSKRSAMTWMLSFLWPTLPSGESVRCWLLTANFLRRAELWP